MVQPNHQAFILKDKKPRQKDVVSGLLIASEGMTYDGNTPRKVHSEDEVVTLYGRHSTLHLAYKKMLKYGIPVSTYVCNVGQVATTPLTTPLASKPAPSNTKTGTNPSPAVSPKAGGSQTQAKPVIKTASTTGASGNPSVSPPPPVQYSTSTAVATLTVSSVGTSGGLVTIFLGSLEDSVQVFVGKNDTVSVVASNIKTALNAIFSDVLDITTALGVVTLTAKNDGKDIEDWVVGYSAPEDLGLKIDVTQFTGATPTIVSDFSDILNTPIRFNYIGVVSNIDDGLLAQFSLKLTSIFNVDKGLKQAFMFYTKQGSSVSEATALSSSIENHNVVVFADKTKATQTSFGETTFIGSISGARPLDITVDFLALNVLRRVEDADLSVFKEQNSRFPLKGGLSATASPFHNAILPTITQFAGMYWTETEMDELASKGASVLTVSQDGETPVVGDVFTTNVSDTEADYGFYRYNRVLSYVVYRDYKYGKLQALVLDKTLVKGKAQRGVGQIGSDTIENFDNIIIEDLANAGIIDRAYLSTLRENRVIEIDAVRGLIHITELVQVVNQVRGVFTNLIVSRVGG